MDQGEDNVKVRFQAISPGEINTSLRQVKRVSPDSNNPEERQLHPTFGSRPDTTRGFRFPK